MLSSLFAISNAALCQPPAPLEYKNLLAETRRIEKLEGDEYLISNKVLFKQARLNLRPFGRGSDAMYVTKADEVAFVCEPALKNFKGGWVIATVEKHEPGAEGSHLFHMSSCLAEK